MFNYRCFANLNLLFFYVLVAVVVAMKICQIHHLGELHDFTWIECTLNSRIMNGLVGSTRGNTVRSKRIPLKKQTHCPRSLRCLNPVSVKADL